MMTLADVMEFELDLEFEHIFIQSEYRRNTLENCKNQAEKDKWLDRWSQEDSADKIARAVRSIHIPRRSWW